MRDLVCHLVIDAQDVLITLVTPAEAAPTREAVTYWEVSGTPPTGDDPLDALTVRMAAAYGEPWLLRYHLDDVGSAAGRAATLADPAMVVGTRGEVLTAGDYLSSPAAAPDHPPHQEGSLSPTVERTHQPRPRSRIC